jgi:hypothetical protein
MTPNHHGPFKPAQRNNGFFKNSVVNASSYGASTAFSITILAAEHLHAHNQEPTGDTLQYLAQVLHKILREVQQECAADISPVLSDQTDLMALLRTCMDQDPVPMVTQVTMFADVAGIEEWMKQTVTNMLHMVRVSKVLTLDALRGPEITDPEFFLAHFLSGIDPTADDDA